MGGAAVIELSHGPHRLGVAPEVGGAITHFRSVLRSGRQIDWMRPYVDRGRGPLDMASFVCLPFFSWLEKDRFEYQGLQVDLPPSGLGFERCLLGLGWTSVWQLSARGSDWLALEHHNAGGAWPWRYQATQTLRLDERGLEQRVLLRNLHDRPMPAGIGLHPFFPWPESLRVQATVKQMHVMSAQGLPCAVDADHPAVQALREGQALHAGLDNLFEGWDGSAVLHMPWGRLRIRADAAYGFLCINSSPADRAYCCIEPVTHTTNALHRPHLQGGRTGHVLLAPGEALEATAWFDPEFNDD